MKNVSVIKDAEMRMIDGGGNVSGCLLSVSGMALGLASGQWWATIGAGAAAFSSGYNCAALISEGDQ